MCSESKYLLLKWTCELLSQAKMFLGTLATTQEMGLLVDALCHVAASVNTSISLLACASLEYLLSIPSNLYWKVSKIFV